jgi:hypothetical protein
MEYTKYGLFVGLILIAAMIVGVLIVPVAFAVAPFGIVLIPIAFILYAIPSIIVAVVDRFLLFSTLQYSSCDVMKGSIMNTECARFFTISLLTILIFCTIVGFLTGYIVNKFNKS